MGVKSRQMLNILVEVGLASGKSHSSSLNEEEAAKVRAHFRRGKELAGQGRGDFVASRSSQTFHVPVIDLSVLDTKPKWRESPKSLIDQKTLTSTGRAPGTRGVAASGTSHLEPIGTTLTDGNSEKEQKSICPVCNRTIDLRKLPIYINRSYLGGGNPATPRLVACPVCKMPPDKKNARNI
jgi:hypothetical protein